MGTDAERSSGYRGTVHSEVQRNSGYRGTDSSQYYNIYANKQSFHQSSYIKMLQNSVIRQEISLVLRILAFRGTFLVVTEQPLAVFILEDALDSLIRPATFLSHRRKPEVNITHPRTVFSPRFSN